MNKRIKEFAVQAGFKTFAGLDIWAAEQDHPDDEGRVDIELNKFINLIIQECVKVCTEDKIEVPMGLYYSKLIMEHFGVE